MSYRRWRLITSSPEAWDKAVIKRLVSISPVWSLSSGSGMFSKYITASAFWEAATVWLRDTSTLNGLKRKKKSARIATADVGITTFRMFLLGREAVSALGTVVDLAYSQFLRSLR